MADLPLAIDLFNIEDVLLRISFKADAAVRPRFANQVGPGEPRAIRTPSARILMLNAQPPCSRVIMHDHELCVLMPAPDWLTCRWLINMLIIFWMLSTDY